MRAAAEPHAPQKNPTFTVTDWAVQRLRHEAILAADSKAFVERLPKTQQCSANAEKSNALVGILSNADPRVRQELGAAALEGNSFHAFICHYRDALDKVFGHSEVAVTRPQLPDVALAAQEASVQLILQGVHACGNCKDAALLKTVAAGSAIAARMYPEALRLLFDLIEIRHDLRDVYESVQKTYAAKQRGKGEVSLSSPR